MRPVLVEHEAALERHLRRRAFSPRMDPARALVGAEVELIPVCAHSGARIPVDAVEGVSSLRWLRELAHRQGWTEERLGGGASRFLLPAGGALSFEPGGQVEYSSPPCASPRALLALLASVMDVLHCSALEHGIELLSIGLDPATSVERVPLQLHGERYVRMAEYFAHRGPEGALMMRHTASFQLNLDFEHEPLRRWRALNALAPYVVAIFANSPLHEEHPTGHASTRAHVWRQLDPSRTGLLRGGDDAVAEYQALALDAPMILAPDAAGEHPTARARLARGELSLEEWRAHLTTLFPEVRPKGYLELRSADAVDPRWHAAPIALIAGLLYHAPSLRAAEELLGPPDAELLRRCGERGLGDSSIATVARDLATIALAGCRALGDGFLDERNAEVACEYFTRYTARGRTPADDLLSTAEARAN